MVPLLCCIIVYIATITLQLVTMCSLHTAFGLLSFGKLWPVIMSHLSWVFPRRFTLITEPENNTLLSPGNQPKEAPRNEQQQKKKCVAMWETGINVFSSQVCLMCLVLMALSIIYTLSTQFPNLYKTSPYEKRNRYPCPFPSLPHTLPKWPPVSEYLRRKQRHTQCHEVKKRKSKVGSR